MGHSEAIFYQNEAPHRRAMPCQAMLCRRESSNYSPSFSTSLLLIHLGVICSASEKKIKRKQLPSKAETLAHFENRLSEHHGFFF